jgi:hypothetical protein
MAFAEVILRKDSERPIRTFLSHPRIFAVQSALPTLTLASCLEN